MEERAMEKKRITALIADMEVVQSAFIVESGFC